MRERSPNFSLYPARMKMSGQGRVSKWMQDTRTRNGPLALLQHGLNGFCDSWMRSSDIINLKSSLLDISVKALWKISYGEILEGPCFLNICKSSLEVLQLHINLFGCFLRLGNLEICFNH